MAISGVRGQRPQLPQDHAQTQRPPAGAGPDVAATRREAVRSDDPGKTQGPPAKSDGRQGDHSVQRHADVGLLKRKAIQRQMMARSRSTGRQSTSMQPCRPPGDFRFMQTQGGQNSSPQVIVRTDGRIYNLKGPIAQRLASRAQHGAAGQRPTRFQGLYGNIGRSAIMDYLDNEADASVSGIAVTRTGELLELGANVQRDDDSFLLVIEHSKPDADGAAPKAEGTARSTVENSGALPPSADADRAEAKAEPGWARRAQEELEKKGVPPEMIAQTITAMAQAMRETAGKIAETTTESSQNVVRSIGDIGDVASARS